MRLSWQEIRAKAKAFSDEWKDAHYEKGETQSFYNAFFRVFGAERKKVATYEHAVRKFGGGTGFIDLFWPGTLVVEQKSKGKDLLKAETQAIDYLYKLPDVEHPRYVLACDFQTFHLRDLETGNTTDFALPDLHKHVEKFGFINGVQVRRFKDQDPVNIKAAELVGVLHDELEKAGYTGHRLERFLVRIVFCLFADDTGIFQPKDILWDYLESRTKPDGSDTGPLLNQLFAVLDTPEDRRSANLDADLAQFPYVNGDLFAEDLRAPDFNADMRAALVNACRFDWTPISPAIFGSLFQSVMDPKERRERGAHYTTEANIMKVIEPLFLDDLKAELEKAKGRKRGKRQALEAFQARLATLTFFDPACGCGNFLIIAYREIRQLELEVMRELKAMGELALLQSVVDVNQFYGIEYDEFPARIAETALWMMDHLMNNALSLEFGELYARIPLKRAPTIYNGDALEKDWAEVLAPERCSYVLGNPPFVGFVFRTKEQKAGFDAVLARCGVKGSRLDYVFGWFLKAAEYAQGGEPRIGLVATNSISQGEQVAVVWPAILDRFGMVISFAHRTFEWGSEARGKAHVHVVIVGMERKKNERAEKRLFNYRTIKSDPEETRHAKLSPYLIDSSALANPNLVIQRASRPLNGLPVLRVGTKPVDAGHYIFSAKEMASFLAVEPGAERLFRPFLGAREFLNGIQRYILWVSGEEPSVLRALPKVMERVRLVRETRELGESALSKGLAGTPTEFHVTVKPDGPFVALPEVSSERRVYLPVGYLTPPDTPSNKLLVALNYERSHFGLLQSLMHTAWLREVGGKLKSDFQYSPGLVYNTFPLPDAPLDPLEPLAQAVLDARAAHPGATLADLYDPDLMPPDLRRAHAALDRAVDRLYRKSPFDSDRERVEHLFMRYEKMVKPLLAGERKKGRRRTA